MPINFRCPICHQRLRAPDEAAGRRTYCKCGTRIVVPRGHRPGSSPEIPVARPVRPPPGWHGHYAPGAAPPVRVPAGAGSAAETCWDVPLPPTSRVALWVGLAGGGSILLVAVVVVVVIVLSLRSGRPDVPAPKKDDGPPVAQAPPPVAVPVVQPPVDPKPPPPTPTAPAAPPTPKVPPKSPTPPPTTPTGEPLRDPVPEFTGGIKRVAAEPEPEVPTGALRRISAHGRTVLRVAFTPDGGRLLSAGADGVISRWDVASGKLLSRLDVGGSARDVAFSADGRRAAVWRMVGGSAPTGGTAGTAGANDFLDVWDLEGGKKVCALPCGVLEGVAMSADGSRVVASMPLTRFEPGVGVSTPARSGFMCWDATTGQTVAEGSTPLGHRLMFTADGRRVLSTRFMKNSGAVLLTDLFGGRSAVQLEVPGDMHPLGVALSADGRRVLAGTVKHGVALWDMPTGRLVRMLPGHTGRAFAVAFTPDGRRALSCGAGTVELGADKRTVRIQPTDCTVRLWDLDRGTELQSFPHHQPAPVYTVAISPGGRRAATGDESGVVRIWALPK